MRIARHGALAVVEQAHPKDAIQHQLRQLDDRIFLEKQIDLRNDEVWCVVVNVGSEIPPITILEWRDESGHPISYLSERLVQRVQAMDRDGGRLLARVIAENERMIERARTDATETWEEMAEDMGPRLSGLRSAAFPRGVYLQRSRERMRAKGHNV